MDPVLTFSHISKRYTRYVDRPRSFLDAFVSGLWNRRRGTSEEFWVLRDFSLSISRGEAVGVIGDNGAGKSTILKLGARIVEPTSGAVTLNGRVGALLEVGVGFHPDLSGRENVFLSGSMIGLGRHDMAARFDEIVDFSGVEKFIDMPVRHYSSGMLIRLGFSVATSIDPDVLLVDEVLSVGDMTFRQKCMDRIDGLRENGTAILYVSHNLGEVRSVCSRAVWLHEAEVRAHGLPDEVVREYTNYTLRQRGLAVHELGTVEGRGGRLGSGGLEITDCMLLDRGGQPARSWKGGQPMILRVDYRCQRALREVIFGVSVYTEDGIRVANPDSPVYHDLRKYGDLHYYQKRSGAEIDFLLAD
ncbi:MAG: ATP-binding cassette domain-containing protein, partial [Anaerolineae bacterium]|nr:ATP-binding cassette domain-containing protein [Anaerolineae bacterium]